MPLKKSLGFFALTMYGVGIILGAGIYALIGKATLLAGTSVWLSFVLGAILASFTGLSYAELSSAYPKASAEANYLKHAFKKDWLAFLTGWLVVAIGFVTAATVALGFAGYLASFVQLPIVLVAIALIILLSIVSFAGIDTSAKLNIVFTLIEALGIIIVIFLGIPFFGKVDYFQLSNGFGGVLNATAIIFFAYIGFEAIAKLGEETIKPEKILPRALVASIIVSSILYILLSLSAVSILPTAELGKSSAPLMDVALKAGGANMGFLLGIMALIATLNTVLITLIVSSRMLYGLGTKHGLPKIVAAVHKKTKTPHIAILITALGSIAMLAVGEIDAIAKTTTFMTFLVFLAVNLALIFLRRKKEFLPAFRMPLNIGNFSIIAFLGAASSLLMLFTYSFVEAIVTIGFIVLGLALYWLGKKIAQKNKTVTVPPLNS